ncbi:hypothetical protein ACSBR2_028965 [Camellia fascicularis]
MYLLGTTLFANRENNMGLYLLEALVHLLQVIEYDWGGTGLATLYCYMSYVSRRKVDSFGGYWRVWKVHLIFTSSIQLYILFNFAFSTNLCFAFPVCLLICLL